MTITFSDLKKAYDNAVAEGRPEFQIETHQFATGYAKYLIEWLDMQKCPTTMVLEFGKLTPCKESNA
jgi:hypothetical protein